MKPQIASVIFMIVASATIINGNSTMSENFSTITTEEPANNLTQESQKIREKEGLEINGTLDETNATLKEPPTNTHKHKDVPSITLLEEVVLFFFGFLLFVCLYPLLHLIAKMFDRGRMQQIAFDRALLNERNRGPEYRQVLQWARNPQAHPRPVISNPYCGVPSVVFNVERENVNLRREAETNHVDRQVRGVWGGRPTISNPMPYRQ